MFRFDNMQARALTTVVLVANGQVMTRKALLMLAAAAALAGCNKESHTIVAGPPSYDDDANAAANANVELPPAIVATKIYRCADNAVVTVNYLSDNKSANVLMDKASPVRVTTDDPTKPMTAEGGYSVEGSPTSGTAKITVPGHAAQSCNA